MFNCFRIRWNDPRLRRFNGSLKISSPCQIQNTRRRHNTDTNKCLWRHLTRDEPETVSTNESAGKVTPDQSQCLKLTNRSSLSMAKPETLVSCEDLLWILYLCLFCSSFNKIDKNEFIWNTNWLRSVMPIWYFLSTEAGIWRPTTKKCSKNEICHLWNERGFHSTPKNSQTQFRMALSKPIRIQEKLTSPERECSQSKNYQLHHELVENICEQIFWFIC